MTTSDKRSFAPLDGAQFIVLTTYRRTGAAVPTTVWFAEREGTLYITTGGAAGKAKRIRANPQVTVAPSDRVGNVNGPTVAAYAREAVDEEHTMAEAALAAKYGEQLSFFRQKRGTPAGSTHLVVTPAE